MSQQQYKSMARQIRELALRMRNRSGAYHIGGDLSYADVLAVLYTDVLRIKPSDPSWPKRDRFILSKGHACASFYAALALRKFFPQKLLESFYQNGGKLYGHATRSAPGIELSTGSLGHGLPMGCGMALAGKRDKNNYRVFVLLSDGEVDEGAVWESALFAPHHRLDNLVVIIDYNKFQSMDKTKEVLDLDPLGEKWQSFGWGVKEIDGHNLKEIETALTSVPFSKGKPSCIVAHTIKGKGVSFMEDSVHWHYRRPDDEQLKQALKEIYAD